MHVADVTTPLRQLYFIVQIMLMNPADTPAARQMFDEALRVNRENFNDAEILAGLANAERLVADNRKFDALKAIRILLPIEAEIIDSKAAAPNQAA